MKILIVDDEPLARARLAALVAELGADEVVAEADSGTQALRAVEEWGPEIVLLDIRMPRMDGLEVARHLNRLEQPPAVIFTTAYESHALEAFEANAVDYLLKPVRKARLESALARASSLTRAQVSGLGAAALPGGDQRTHVSATLHGNLQLVPVAEVRFFRAEHKYVVARHPDGELLLDDTIEALEREFGDRFLRVHRNALVAVEHARGVRKGSGGGHEVVFDVIDDRVEVSRRMLARVKRSLA